MRTWNNGQAATSHEQAADRLGRMTKYVYDNPGSGRAVMVLNCNHQFAQEFANGEAEVKASLDFQEEPGNEPGKDRPMMKLSVVVVLRKADAKPAGEDVDACPLDDLG